jgi:hypothetical protein
MASANGVPIKRDKASVFYCIEPFLAIFKQAASSSQQKRKKGTSEELSSFLSTNRYEKAKDTISSTTFLIDAPYQAQV